MTANLKFTTANSNSLRQIQIPPHITSFRTLEVVQDIGGCSGHLGDNISTVEDSFSTVGDSFSTVEGIQYIGDNISTVGVPSVLWGITLVMWRLLSTVEIRLQILRIFKESLNLFQKLISLRNQIDHIAGSSGQRSRVQNPEVLGKILL